jgi:hypothetical protein
LGQIVEESEDIDESIVPEVLPMPLLNEPSPVNVFPDVSERLGEIVAMIYLSKVSVLIKLNFIRLNHLWRIQD